MEPNKTFTENHNWMFIEINCLTKFHYIFLKDVDDLLSEQIWKPLSSFYWGLNSQKEGSFIWFIVLIVWIESKFSKNAIKFRILNVLLHIWNDHVFNQTTCSSHHILKFAVLSILIQSFRNFHE
jgi:hypothetical protein